MGSSGNDSRSFACGVNVSRIRVVVVDDQRLVRTGFTAILSTEDDIEVIGEASNGEEAIALVDALRPDVVLMDIRMPVMDGVEATLRLAGAGASSPTKVLILTTFDIDELVHNALQAGASGFLLKDAPPEELVHAIRVIAAGDALLAPSVTRRLLDTFAGQRRVADTSPVATEAVSRLTDREREVLVYMARGLSNGEIATAMYLGETTIKTYVGRILSKLAARDRVQAVVTAFDAGLVVPGKD
jgi:DNA-binding NarL/FixJ family response regulator